MPPTHAVLPAGHDFATYAGTHWSRLLVTARLLTDTDTDTEVTGAAEELVRRTLVRMYARWRWVPRDDVDFHVRRCLVREYLRRPGAGRGRWRGRRAARRRVVRVLRLWEGLPDREIAQLLGCSVGAVRAYGKQADGEEIRRAYARAAADPVPGPSDAPLAELRARGRARRRRRAAVTGAVCAALLAPAALLAADHFGGAASETVSGEHARPATSPVRVVAPGERVTAGAGVRVWLTAEGGHWSVPGSYAESGGDPPGPKSSRPAVSVRADTVQDGFFLSGLFSGVRGEPSRVEVRTGAGRVTAKVLVLAGSPGWGVWYASAPLPKENMQALFATGGDERVVTVYDASGEVAARSESEWWRI
ncbi:hypothetical protein ACIQAC_10135 [Streptomyces sp. NPDC088387]|uniref:hypothetical protein n=1 Tax=Streptomyces sp. NPDC088387 TaxID=3365859 RepID=UPI0037F49725